MNDFSQFWVNLWQQIVDFFTDTSNGMSMINKIAIAISILVVGLLLVKIVFSLLKRAFKVNDTTTKSPRKTVARFILNALKTIFVFIIILFALSTLGFRMDGLATIISSGILAIGVSLQDVIGNFASGIIILSSKLFVEGDYIEVNDNVAGTVKEIKMMTTILLTPDNITVTVPNNTMTKGKVSNFNAAPIRRVNLTVGVAYGTDLDAARKILMNIILSDERILKDESVTVAVKNLGSSSIDICVRGYVKTEDYWPVNFDLNQKIATELAKRNINIPFNQVDVNLYANGETNPKKVDLKGVPKDVLDYKPLPHPVEENNDLNKALDAAKKIFKRSKKNAKTKKVETTTPVEVENKEENISVTADEITSETNSKESK